MLINEFIPLCHTRGLGTTPASVGAIGVSMGGYGAILLAEKHPTQIAAVAAISPAIWTSYTEAAHVNPVAYAIAQDFAQDNVPFHDGVLALARKLGSNATVDFSGGCHDTTYFASSSNAPSSSSPTTSSDPAGIAITRDARVQRVSRPACDIVSVAAERSVRRCLPRAIASAWNAGLSRSWPACAIGDFIAAGLD